MSSRKGTEHAVWIIIVIVISLVVAVVLITVVSNTTSNAGDQSNTQIKASGSILSAITCRLQCEACRFSSDPGCYSGKKSCEGYSC